MAFVDHFCTNVCTLYLNHRESLWTLEAVKMLLLTHMFSYSLVGEKRAGFWYFSLHFFIPHSLFCQQYFERCCNRSRQSYNLKIPFTDCAGSMFMIRKKLELKGSWRRARNAKTKSIIHFAFQFSSSQYASTICSSYYIKYNLERWRNESLSTLVA